MKVVIVGGTHGNEKSGVFLVQKYLKYKDLLPTGHTYKFCMGNPEAVKKNCRYLDDDLNRSFGPTPASESSREGQRVLELKSEISAWAQGEPFFLIDLHTSTSNMGTSLVLSKNDRLSAHVLQQAVEGLPQGHLVFNTEDSKGQCFLESLAPHGVLVEVGPVAQNVFDPNGIKKTEEALLAILNILLKFEGQALKPIALQGFQEEGTYAYPQDGQGRVTAHLHGDFFGKDFKKLEAGAPIFVSESGQDLRYDGEETLYPIFIGEAAYLETGTAFMKSKKVSKTF